MPILMDLLVWDESGQSAYDRHSVRKARGLSLFLFIEQAKRGLSCVSHSGCKLYFKPVARPERLVGFKQ
jgi:hypothetical protein